MSDSNYETECICVDDFGGIKAYIQIYYGPHVAWGILRHRTQRLKHLVGIDGTVNAYFEIYFIFIEQL